MSKQLEAYIERKKRNDKYFRDTAAILKELGYTVKAPRNELITFITVEKDNLHVGIEFREVPYRWGAYKELDPSLKEGSYKTIKESFEPFGIGEIIELMSSIKFKQSDKFYMKEL